VAILEAILEAVAILVPVKPGAWCPARWAGSASASDRECFGRWLLMLKDMALQFVNQKQGKEEVSLDDW
jgi:hypothetical protein